MIAAPSPVLLLAVLAQVLLTLLMYLALARAKARAAGAGQVDEARRALHADAWPEDVQKINNNIRNQFEVPVLFYVVVIVLCLLGETGRLVQGLAWLFVASRIAHALVHTGPNIVTIRRRVFMVGCAIVMVLMGLAMRAAVIAT